MKLSLDIETACGVSGCADRDCKHALDFNRNRITCVGLYGESHDGRLVSEVHRDIGHLSRRLVSLSPTLLVGHNIISFDLKTLKAKGLDLTHIPTDDTQLMAVAAVNKIPESWLETYEAKRKAINKALPHGHKGHREAGQHSLKTLAPFFLGVEPFWETTDGHDNDEYVLRDCEYTYRLYTYLCKALKQEGTEDFYRKKLLPWAWMLFQAEWQGVSLDFQKMAAKEKEASERAARAKAELDEFWAGAYEAYQDAQEGQLWEEYQAKSQAAVARLKAPTPEKIEKTRARYAALADKAICKLEPLNLDSPVQMTWLLRDHLGYDITDYEGEETTGIEVLERLAAEGKEDIKRLIEYREAQKLCTSFFPSYRDYSYNGKIHCNFSLSRTRTGRTSSSTPNLQQQPGHVRDIFISRPGFTLVTRDLSGIEPVLIAYYSRDPFLCSWLVSGGNIHDQCTPMFFPEIDCDPKQIKKLYPLQRDAAKEADLSLFYGAGWRRLMISAMKRGIRWSEYEAKQRYETFKEQYETVFRFKKESLDPLASAGNPITNLFGRKFKVAKEDVHMKAFNTLIQSSASDLLLRSGQKIREEFQARGIDGAPILFVHDEIVVEVEDSKLNEAIGIIEKSMTDYKLETEYGRLPLKVEGGTGKFWSK